MKRLLCGIAVSALTVLLSGCFAQQYVAGAVDKPAMMSGAAAEKKEFSVLKHFTVTDRSGWFLFGLIKSGHTNLNEIIQDELKSAGGEGVINLKIETIYDPVDVLIGLLVGGLYNTRATHLEGDIIKYR